MFLEGKLIPIAIGVGFQLLTSNSNGQVDTVIIDGSY